MATRWRDSPGSGADGMENWEGLDFYLQLPREVRCIRSAVVVEGEAKVQALVRVWSKTQLVLRTQQECTLVQTVLPGEREGLKEDSRGSRGQETRWTLAQAVGWPALLPHPRPSAAKPPNTDACLHRCRV